MKKMSKNEPCSLIIKCEPKIRDLEIFLNNQ